MINTVYLIGSLRNPAVPHLGNKFRERGIEAFDNWWAAGKIADDSWQEYNDIKGNDFKKALNSYEAKHVFEFDKKHLDRSDAAVLVLPAGKSGHLEIGYMVGKGKPTYVLFDKVPDRYDVMYQFCTDVFFNEDDLLTEIKAYGRNIEQVGRPVPRFSEAS